MTNTLHVKHKIQYGSCVSIIFIKLNRDANTHHRCSMLVFHPCWPVEPSSTHLWIWHLKKLVHVLQLFQAQQCCLSSQTKQMFIWGNETQ